MFVILKTQYKILACGTIHTSSKGGDPVVMNLSTSANRGESKTCYNPINGILFGQWKDNKVVSFISTLALVGNGTTMRECGSEKVLITCPKALQAYNKYMGYVDLVDFDKNIGRSFTHKSGFKNGEY